MRIHLLEAIRVVNLDVEASGSKLRPSARPAVDAVVVERPEASPSPRLLAGMPSPEVSPDAADMWPRDATEDPPVSAYRARQALRAYGRVLARRAEDRR